MMHAQSDLALLQRWRQQGDPHAFKALTQRYGGMVFAVSNRVLRNSADAEEVTQDCFLKLAQHPEQPCRSVGAWLHSVAVRTSINRIRSDQRRRARESNYEKERPEGSSDSAGDLLDHVDDAISTLPDDLRACIVGHFLSNRSQREIASELGSSARTVRRKTDEAIARVREELAQRGITTSMGALALVLAGQQAEAAPPALAATLGKIAVSGRASGQKVSHWAAAEAGIFSGGMGNLKGAILLIAGAGVLAASLWWGMGTSTSHPEEPVVAALAVEPPQEPDTLHDNSPGETPAETTAPPANDQSILVPTPLTPIDAIRPIANPTRYGALSGRVLTEDGQPVAGATVRLAVTGLEEGEFDRITVPGFPAVSGSMDENLAAARREAALELVLASTGHQYDTITDSDGSFHLGRIRYAGEARVMATAADLAMPLIRTAIREDEQTEIQLTLRPARTLRGQLFGRDGAAIPDAAVTPIARYSVVRGPNGEIIAGGGGSGTPLPQPFQARSDAAGNFSLAIADADMAALLVTCDSFGAAIFPEVAVENEAFQTLTWTSMPGTLRGQILLEDGSPASAHHVHIVGSLVADSGGTRPGPFTKSTVFESAATGSATPGSIMKSGTAGSSRSGGHGRSNNDGDAGSGSMNGGSGSFGSGISPRSPVPLTGTNRLVETDTEGRFELASLPSGETYKATVYDGLGQKAGVAVVPDLTPGGITPWHCTLEAPLRVSGRVVGITTGNGLGGVLVRACPVGNAPHFSPQDATRTAPDGRFTLAVFDDAGDYNLMPSIDASAPVTADAPYAVRVTLQPNETHDLTLQLPDPWSRRFRILGSSGRPVTGVQVQLHQANPDGSGFSKQLSGVTTDSMGYLTIDALSGDARVQALFTKTGYLDTMSPWRAAEDGPRGVVESVTLYADASATLRALNPSGMQFPDTEFLCKVSYGGGLELVRKVRTDRDGWIVLEESLPATVVRVSLRVAAPEPQGVAMGGFGEMPPQIRAAMAARDLRRAEEAGTAVGETGNVLLIEHEVNELGEVILE